MKQLSYVIKTQLFQGNKFALKETVFNYIFKKLKNKEAHITVFVITTDGIMKMSPDEMSFLCIEYSKNRYNNYQLGSYRLMWFGFVANTTTITGDPEKDKIEIALLNRFHYSWYNVLRKFLLSTYVPKILPVITGERKKFNIFPEQTKILSAFTNTDINEIRVCIVGQDPYPHNHANGIAFATDQNEFPQSLKMIEKALFKYYEDQGKASSSLDGSLQSWIKQGVFLFNRSLTVREGQPNSHKGAWTSFFKYVIGVLSTRPNRVIFVLMGSKAQEAKEFIADHHTIIETEHPAKALYEKREWNSNNCFKQVDESLGLYSTKIKWLNEK